MNLAQYLVASASSHPDKTAIRHEGDQITYGELDRASNRLAQGLANQAAWSWASWVFRWQEPQ